MVQAVGDTLMFQSAPRRQAAVLSFVETGEVVKFKRSDVIGKECGVTVEDTEYNGNVRSQIQNVVSLSDLAKLKAQA